MESNPGKLLMTIGGVLFFVGVAWHFGGRFFSFGRLPGDLSIERENFKFYFPLGSSILLSVVLSLIAWAIRYFKNP